MRRWREIYLIALCLAGSLRLARSEPQPGLPQDFLTAFHAVDAAYERKDIEGVVSNYAPNCTFILITFSLRKAADIPGYKASYNLVSSGRERHDLAWQRQELQKLFFVPRQPFGPGLSLPLQTISIHSDIQKSASNRKATELRLTVERKIYSHQGQAQGIQNEVDEEIWVKGAQGWKLKRRTINPKGGWTDYS